jgi:hypothetical protein
VAAEAGEAFAYTGPRKSTELQRERDRRTIAQRGERRSEKYLIVICMTFPFVLSLSKGEQLVSPQPVKAYILPFDYRSPLPSRAMALS